MKILTIASFLLYSLTISCCYAMEESSITGLQKEIKQGYDQANFNILRETHLKFEKLAFNDEVWKGTIDQLKIYQWPEQTLKQAVGGHLFYPPNVNDLWDYSYLNHFLKRTDIIWGFAISAKYHNPLSRYYLAWGLDNIGTGVKYGCDGRDPFITHLYTEAFRILEQSFGSNPEACYILGINHASYGWKIGIKSIDINKSLMYHKVGASLKDPRNKLRSLEIQEIYKGVFKESPKIEEYVRLGEEEDYPPAYLMASQLEEEDIKRKISYLEKSTTLKGNFPQGFIEMGEVYEFEDDIGKAHECYYNAAVQGLTTGYIQIAKTILGDLIAEKKSREGLLREAHSVNDFNVIGVAENYLTAAINLNDPQACAQLIALYKSLHLIEDNNSSSYLPKLASTLKKGMQLGLGSAYRKVYKLSREHYEEFVRSYGVNPEDGLSKSIEEFLFSKINS